ncbi:MAG: phosphodiester glycosidase family protein [Candidatus Levyibacteriota bacterium]|jgi:hypothetical protein
MTVKSKPKTKHKKIRKRSLRKPFFKLTSIATCIAIFLIVIIGGFYLLLRVNQTFAANFADNVLRPRIGNQATIYIESVFFGIEDNVNRVKYSFVKANPSELSQNYTVTNASVERSVGFNLAKITSLAYFPFFPGEGEWNQIYSGTMGALMAKTFVRPDSKRSYAIVYLVEMNMNNLVLSAVAGTKEPGGANSPGPGKIPLAVQQSNLLVAAFNGGFQEKDGYYGMVVNGKTYLPLQKNLATLIIYNNTKPKIIDYTGQDLGKNVVAVRQNGPLLLKNSKDVTSSSAWDMQTWGLTTTNSMYTWRSGIGITSNGNLIYAAGPSLVPQTLAAALKAAGAANAMQLDINPVWVRFMIFNSLGNGKYKYYSLSSDMTNGGYQDLTGYQKDFFYLLEK